MNFAPKRWTGLGLGLAILGTAGLTACGGEEGESSAEPASIEAGEAGEAGKATSINTEAGEGGEAGEAGEAGGGAVLSRSKRLAFMTGHVEAGLALYRAGELEMASKHLLHPVSETHAAERAGLDELGFDSALFEVLSEALSAGTSADDLAAQFLAAEQNLAAVTTAAGGDTVEIINFLLQTVVDEYSIGVPAATITDAGEYQDAYGFAVVARRHADALDGEVGQAVRDQLDTLIALWVDGPVPVGTPSAASKVAGQVGNVRLELSSSR